MTVETSYNFPMGKGDRRGLIKVDITKPEGMITPAEEFNNIVDGDYSTKIQATSDGRHQNIFLHFSKPVEKIDEIKIYYEYMNSNYTKDIIFHLEDGSEYIAHSGKFSASAREGVVIPLNTNHNARILSVELTEGDGSYDNFFINEIEFKLSYVDFGKHLIKSSNKIYSLSKETNEWIDTGLIEPLSKEDFETYGIILLTISKEKWSKLRSNFEVLTWADSDEMPKLELTIPEIKPYRLLDNPSIVTYTEDEEVPIISQTVLATTKVRFLVSKNKADYQVYRDNEWITIDKNKILEEGMTKLELESIPQEAWAEWFENEAHKNTFDILIGMYSESPNPIIRSITVNYAENESPIIINAYIEPDTIHNEFATLKAHVKDYEGDRISFKVLIKKAGSDEFIQVSPLEGWYNRATSEEEITQAFNFPYFNSGENDIKLVVKDERGAESEWLGKIILSNTDPIISLTYDDFSMTATIGDDEDDSVAYRLSINDEEIFDYTDFVPTKAHVRHVFDTKKLKFGEENTVTLEVKDTHGGYAKQEFKVIGSYRGLMFKNEDNQYFVDDKGNILMDLLFDETLIGGQTSKTKKVTLENRHEFPISNVKVITQKPIKTKNENGEEVIEIVDGDDFAEGATLELSETEMPFNPKNIIKILETMPVQGTKDFYVRVKTNRDAHQGGYFYIKSTASPVIK